MNRTQKAQLVDFVKGELNEKSFVVLLQYRGLSDEQLYKLRTGLKSKGASLKIAKNTLMKIAVKGTSLEALTPHFSGPVAFAYSNNNDPVALAKTILAQAKENELLKVQIGYLNNNILSFDAIDKLSKLGSLEEVRASFISKLKGHQAGFVRILNAPASGMVALLNNYTSVKK